LGRGEAFAGYTIVRRLGSGGMGEVYLVQHPRLPREDAMKILPESMTADISAHFFGVVGDSAWSECRERVRD
jgi:serine/threonine protein kinase